MTNKNMHLNKPFLLKPAGKDYLWGGRRLNDDFAKGINLTPLAETWECSTHPDGPSIVITGIHKGAFLSDVLQTHPEYLGLHSIAQKELPILIKFIDAKEDLSVQVHPDDAYAMAHENGANGKTEMWYVIDASKDARLVYGLSHTVDKETIKKAIGQGTLEKYLQKVPIKKNDVFYITPGTIHAIGAGALIAEVQENSNITYRMYDYDRIDKTGRKRKLHIEKALDVASLNGVEAPRQSLRVLKYRPGCAVEFLYRCKYFQVERMLVNTERFREMVTFTTTRLSFEVLLCMDGCGSISFEKNEMLPFFRGDCIFAPADSVPVKIHGNAQFLKVSC